jgi:hypothetical protein
MPTEAGTFPSSSSDGSTWNDHYNSDGSLESVIRADDYDRVTDFDVGGRLIRDIEDDGGYYDLNTYSVNGNHHYEDQLPDGQFDEGTDYADGSLTWDYRHTDGWSGHGTESSDRAWQL